MSCQNQHWDLCGKTPHPTGPVKGPWQGRGGPTEGEECAIVQVARGFTQAPHLLKLLLIEPEIVTVMQLLGTEPP